ncbi:MAG: hypothetical protein ACLQU3_21725 [Limisphaerales bacterium]
MYVTFADSLADVLLPLLPILAASYFTSLLCRLAHWRHRHVRWWFGLLGAGTAFVSVVCFIQLGSSLQHGEDSYGMIHWLCRVACPAASLFAVIPAELVVWRYCKAYRGAEYVA